MKLTKMIPARRETAVAKWCNREFTVYSEEYKLARSHCKHQMNTCWWCGHPFLFGEMIALAQFEKGNKVLCQGCAGELMKGEDHDKTGV